MKYANGDVYIGDWKNNAKFGQGKYIFKQGDSFEGTWFEGEKFGKGTVRFTDGS